MYHQRAADFDAIPVIDLDKNSPDHSSGLAVETHNPLAFIKPVASSA